MIEARARGVQGVLLTDPARAADFVLLRASFVLLGASYVVTTLNFNRPVPAHHWLQASNPSERWKWDFMFCAIQLKEVK